MRTKFVNTYGLTSRDLFALIFSIIFHDVGNWLSRSEHQRKISQIFDLVFPPNDFHEVEGIRRIICDAGKAHCGEALDGSSHTLADVDQTGQLFSQEVKLKEIATILRFADELAEGPHRTSSFMHRLKKYTDASRIYHDYANSVSTYIDHGNNRIALTYTLNIRVTQKNKMYKSDEKKLIELLPYIYCRIDKLNGERRYAIYHSNIINKFNRTTVTFIFRKNHEDIEDLNGISKNIEINDLVIPGGRTGEFLNFHNEYKPEDLIEKIKQKIEGENGL